MVEERRKHKRDGQLSEEDRDAIARKVFSRFQDQFYMNVGKGLWRLVWKVVILGLIAIAAYGAGGGQLFKFGGN